MIDCIQDIKVSEGVKKREMVTQVLGKEKVSHNRNNKIRAVNLWVEMILTKFKQDGNLERDPMRKENADPRKATAVLKPHGLL